MKLLAVAALFFAFVCFVTPGEHVLISHGGGVALLLGAGFLYFRSRRRPAQAVELRVTTEGVSVVAGPKTISHVSWLRLVEVEVVTTSAGPWAEDVFFCLKDAAGGDCIVPHALVSELLNRLQRLPGFDHQKLIMATGSTSEARFLCWTGRPGDARVAAETPPDATLPTG